ncbi:hypothetical protein GCM10028820_06150 [Tessaracoccus terricola]
MPVLEVVGGEGVLDACDPSLEQVRVPVHEGAQKNWVAEIVSQATQYSCIEDGHSAHRAMIDAQTRVSPP